MAFDGITIAAIRKELADTLKDGRISKIAQPEPDELLLTINTCWTIQACIIRQSLPSSCLLDGRK